MNRFNDRIFPSTLEDDFADLPCYDGKCMDQILSLINSATKQRLGKLDPHTLIEFVDAKQISTISILTAVVYIKKLMNTKSCKSILNEITSIDLFVVSVMVASKYLYDDDECNAYWAEEFNMELAELNKLEIKFLYALDWHFFTTYREITELGMKMGIIKCEDHLAKFKSFYSNLLRPTLYQCLRFRKANSAAKMLLLLSVYVAWISSSTDHRMEQNNSPNLNDSRVSAELFGNEDDHSIARMIGLKPDFSIAFRSKSCRNKNAISNKCIDTYNNQSIFKLVPCVL